MCGVTQTPNCVIGGQPWAGAAGGLKLNPAQSVCGMAGEARTLEPGGDLVLGVADLAAAFMRHHLIDEYRLYVHPIVIGRGKPLFQPSDARINLRLAETGTFGNDVVLLRYQRADARRRGTISAQAS